MLKRSKSSGGLYTLPDGQVIVDPRGEELSPSTSSPQPQALEGVTLGLLDNTKWNASILLDSIGRELKKHVQLGEVRMYRKSTWGQPADPDLIDQIVSECDVVITASGD